MRYPLPLLLLCCFCFIFPIKTYATTWLYSFVVWDGNTYIVQEEEVTDVEKEIGHVTRHSSYDSYGGNFSNSYKEGTKYFSIKGVSTEEAIAVETKKGIYLKAVFKGEYKVKDPSYYVYNFLLVGGVIFLFALGYIFYHLTVSKNRKEGDYYIIWLSLG